ncbi:zinc finger protein 26-like isoform X2 [Colias croceus]|uniref:zinc finger protein 26-like isoform X2 n=1 Tax=Colias crocea TaxID=72248 RepID=UPI001E27FE13|nr:zinc finger protein 26-like isoform X2 [Colias croceus]
MFSYRNDHHAERLSTDENITDENSGANSFSEHNLSSEDDFRGFEKIPVVRIERFDISKYVNDGEHRNENVQLEKDAAKNSAVTKFLQECVVKLVREDLEQLKETYTKNVLLNKETVKDCDAKLMLKCKICEKAYTSEKKLKNHQENKHLLVYKPRAKTPKRVSFSDHVIVHEVKEYHRCRKCPKIFENYTALKVHMKRNHKKQFMQPKLVLEKIKVGGRVVSEPLKFVKVKNVDIQSGEIKKPVIDPVSKKTIISKHQCATCMKYFSSNYCLNRHILKVHKKFDDLQCHRCEEIFVWPSLLLSHNCIRDNIPEMPFDDARPEIQIDNMPEDYIDDFDSDMNSLDYDMPAPICELTEYENVRIVLNYDDGTSSTKICVNPLPDYNVLQEVPI